MPFTVLIVLVDVPQFARRRLALDRRVEVVVRHDAEPLDLPRRAVAAAAVAVVPDRNREAVLDDARMDDGAIARRRFRVELDLALLQREPRLPGSSDSW